jgi:hypothetical protein
MKGDGRRQEADEETELMACGGVNTAGVSRAINHLHLQGKKSAEEETSY